MAFSQLAFLALVALAQAQETVLGVYIFSRHGDRTPKALPPTKLTDLGYREVYDRGSYYRNRYVSSSASSPIYGISADQVSLSQLAVSAPADNVLQSSAQGFLQGLYPPVGSELVTQTLRNGSSVQAPMNGYQLIPIALVSSGSGSEDNGWLQDATNCNNAEISSNSYFSSAEYDDLLASTSDFYSNLTEYVNGTFNGIQMTYKNAYSIYDILNVAEIHNSSFDMPDRSFQESLWLANAHEFGLAYNVSDNARAVSGMQLAGEIVTYLNNTITAGNAGKTSNKFGIQFGAYATFLSFFGLSNLTEASNDFYGVNDYASSMVFELFTTTDVSSSSFPSVADMQIRFLFHNGSSANSSDPTAFPLFGQDSVTLPWNDFVGNMSTFAIKTTEEWCTTCGNTTGICAEYAPAAGGDDGGDGSGHGSGISTAVGGVIGAMVTLAVVLGLEAIILLVGGLRVVSKKRLAGAGPSEMKA
ncbi:phosphoglycerate mutase-like protein [Aulographum hederae CBS 113979]|uniref:Phosphoglycerate mutase-like protein n=1 Tax=Aulographum hederae CBS 113979 TaxID=1176131 RepID=A0A6G1GKE2_9PEZI|nr:phosphoglycerate mutase-like protein [Aulographum hederae CBS 113979]